MITFEREGTEGINFRNECEKIFYNASFFIRIEHPVIEIEEVSNKNRILYSRLLLIGIRI